MTVALLGSEGGGGDTCYASQKFESTLAALCYHFESSHGNMVASFPGPAQLSVACSMEKQGEPGIFSHMSDVTTNEKLMNVGGLKHNGVIAHML